MIDRNAVKQILSQYSVLKNYCDTLWLSIYNKYAAHFKCKKGCSDCCILQSVNILEAYVIILNTRHAQKNESATQYSNRCVYLSTSGECTIYSFRPILCRTHGLMLKCKEFKSEIVHSCEYNFTSADFSLKESAIDIDTITLNAEKLSCAFALAAGDLHLSSIRVALEDIKSDSLPQELKFLYQ